MAETVAPAPGVLARLARFSPAAGRTPGEWVVDIAVTVIAGIGWIAMLLVPEIYGQLPAWWRPIDLALGAFSIALVWWSRRFPVAAGLLMIAPATFSLSMGVALYPVIYRLGLLARPRTAILITVAHLLTGLPYHAYLPLPGMDWITWFIVIPLIYALSLCLGFINRGRRQAIVNLRETAARDRERYEERLSTTRRDERERIAREMHDVLAHRISLLSMHAGALEYRATSEAPPSPTEIAEATRVIRESARDAVEDLRELLGVLRSDEELGTGAPQPRLGDLDRLVGEARAAGQRVEFTSDPLPEGIRESTQRTAFRVVQEALTNARKHAPASPVAVRLRAVDGMLDVEVANPLPPGVSTSEVAATGNGLVGLAERVRIDGGEFRRIVEDGEFRLVAELPVGVR